MTIAKIPWDQLFSLQVQPQQFQMRAWRSATSTLSRKRDSAEGDKRVFAWKTRLKKDIWGRKSGGVGLEETPGFSCSETGWAVNGKSIGCNKSATPFEYLDVDETTWGFRFHPFLNLEISCFGGGEREAGGGTTQSSDFSLVQSGQASFCTKVPSIQVPADQDRQHPHCSSDFLDRGWCWLVCFWTVMNGVDYAQLAKA